MLLFFYIFFEKLREISFFRFSCQKGVVKKLCKKNHKKLHFRSYIMCDISSIAFRRVGKYFFPFFYFLKVDTFSSCSDIFLILIFLKYFYLIYFLSSASSISWIWFSHSGFSLSSFTTSNSLSSPSNSASKSSASAEILMKVGK